ncbi:hypothetical protein PQX77_018693 [Marasmius sp. AFHP31]|nr:hypothetical protein PQX77_019563 [Marasmius sp. AFHP31]KAK1218618.1 hypothetical protein PQX77_018693 [Marasmius sp. AFHP31]
MKFYSSIFTLFCLSSTTNVLGSAIPSQFGRRDNVDVGDPHNMVDWSQHQFQAPTETDARSPCPGLNTLANHGFLPRNGNNITIPMVLQASNDGFNVQRNMVLLAAKAALLTSPLDNQFSLADIGLHGNIEHDASLSRLDCNLGDHIPFNESIFTTLSTSNPGVDFYNATSAGQVQKTRLEESKSTNPKLCSTIKELQVRSRESLLYLMVMSSDELGVAPKRFVDVFFREERMPIEEGWRILGVPIDQTSEVPIVVEIIKNSEFVPEEEQCPWVVLAPGGAEDPINEGTI